MENWKSEENISSKIKTSKILEITDPISKFMASNKNRDKPILSVNRTHFDKRQLYSNTATKKGKLGSRDNCKTSIIHLACSFKNDWRIHSKYQDGKSQKGRNQNFKEPYGRMSG